MIHGYNYCMLTKSKQLNYAIRFGLRNTQSGIYRLPEILKIVQLGKFATAQAGQKHYENYDSWNKFIDMHFKNYECGQ